MPIYKLDQYINGKFRNRIEVECSSSDLTAFSNLLVGEVKTYETTITGGTAKSGVVPNPIIFSVGKKVGRAYKSASVRVPHVKPTKAKLEDLKSGSVGLLDCSWDSTQKAEYLNKIYDKVED